MNGYEYEAERAQGIISEGVSLGLYLFYVVVAFTLVTVLARIFYKSGVKFLRVVFEDIELAESVNKLLVIGFCLLNLGYSLVIFQIDSNEQTLTEGISQLVTKIGILAISLGVIHLVNMLVFWRIMKWALRDKQVISQSQASASHQVFPDRGTEGFVPV